MKLTQLRDVIAVAERGSLRAAARQLGVVQPDMTRNIRELESELGVALFERKTKGVVLTPMGEVFLRRALLVQDQLRQAGEEIEQLRARTAGRVSAVLSTASHIALLARALPPFTQRYPDVMLGVTEGLFVAAEAGLKDGSIDFYVGPLTESPPSREFVVEALFENARIIFGRKGHSLGGARSLKDLGQARWIVTALRDHSSAELTPLFQLYGLPPPQVAMHAPSAMTQIEAAANSDFLMMLPEQWLEFPRVEAMLQPIMIEEALRAPAICIVRLARLPLTPAAEYFCDMVRRASEYYVAIRANRHRGAPTSP